MAEPLLRPKTVEVLRQCVLVAEDLHLFQLGKALADHGFLLPDQLKDPSIARFVFDGILKGINWCDRDNIRPILPIFEDAYAESPIAPHTLHSLIDIELARDGFRIEEGHMVRLVT